jgi:hypothetical protein
MSGVANRGRSQLSGGQVRPRRRAKFSSSDRLQGRRSVRRCRDRRPKFHGAKSSESRAPGFMAAHGAAGLGMSTSAGTTALIRRRVTGSAGYGSPMRRSGGGRRSVAMNCASSAVRSWILVAAAIDCLDDRQLMVRPGRVVAHLVWPLCMSSAYPAGRWDQLFVMGSNPSNSVFR